MKVRSILVGVCLALFSFSMDTQAQGDNNSAKQRNYNNTYLPTILENWKRVEIPFEYVNDLIIVEVVINQFLPLKFVFDTGAEHTILTKREVSDLIGLSFTKTFTVMGADMRQELTAYLAPNVSLRLNRFISPNETILVLDEDYFRYEELTGLKIHGILGASFFRRYIVDIDYERQRIRFHKHKYFKINPKKYQELSVEVYKNKPYLFAELNTIGASTIPIKLLFDTGAALPLLVYTETDSSLTVPEKSIPGNIGHGLGGYLSGYRGRIRTLSFSEYDLNNVITSFQIPDSVHVGPIMNNRNGLLGNQIISRFRVVINYWEEKIYLRPNKSYKESFDFDKSGVVLLASGSSLNVFTVQYVIPNSPAEKAGVRKGDIVTRLNGVPTKLLSMSDITDVLKRKPGKKVKLKIKRGTENVKVVFRLREII